MKKQIEELKKWTTDALERRDIVRTWFKYYRIKRSIEYLGQYDSEKSWKKIASGIDHGKSRHRLVYTTVAVAASLILVITFAYLATYKPAEKQKPQSNELITGLYPEKGEKKAVLTLHTGEIINLTATEEKTIANRNDSLLSINQEGVLAYRQGKQDKDDLLQYNTLAVPRGGEYQLVLPDGTNVHLNAESSLHYPISFSKTREISLTGEAYFEVAQSNQPFMINIGTDSKIEVLGTKFNVSAYHDMPIRTTLTEGKVKIQNVESTVILKPNQQATMGQSGKIKVETVDAMQFTSWAHGVYQFKKTELHEIVAQLSRWYDVDMSFKNEDLKHKRFTGVIFRYNELGFAIEAIEKISNVKFTTENNTIYIDNIKQPQ